MLTNRTLAGSVVRIEISSVILILVSDDGT